MKYTYKLKYLSIIIVRVADKAIDDHVYIIIKQHYKINDWIIIMI